MIGKNSIFKMSTQLIQCHIHSQFNFCQTCNVIFIGIKNHKIHMRSFKKLNYCNNLTKSVKQLHTVFHKCFITVIMINICDNDIKTGRSTNETEYRVPQIYPNI